MEYVRELPEVGEIVAVFPKGYEAKDVCVFGRTGVQPRIGVSHGFVRKHSRGFGRVRDYQLIFVKFPENKTLAKIPESRVYRVYAN